MIELKPEQRAVFQQLCGLLLPAWERLPDGSLLQLQEAPLDAALALRSDLTAPFQRLCGELGQPVDNGQVEKMQQRFPVEFKATKLLVCATYYQHPKVKAALKYDGQQALSLPRGGFGCEELVMKMLSGDKRYRDTVKPP